MSKSHRGIKQKLFDFTLILLILAGLTIYAYQKGRFSFTKSGSVPTPSVQNQTTPTPTGLKTYTNNSFPYKFTYALKPKECNKQITVSPLWVIDDSAYGIDIYCESGKNLIQILAEKTDKDINNWWYSLLPDNKSFFEKYGEMKDVDFAGEKAKQISYQKNGKNDHYNQIEIILRKDGINYLLVALDYMCTNDQSCWQGKFEQDTVSSFQFINLKDKTPTPTFSEEQICGGLLGKTCPSGFACQYDGNYPDATGRCVAK